MPLSDYAGRSPGGDAAGCIRRVSRHHQWDLGDGVAADCAYCDAELDLHEQHLLAILEGSDAEGRLPRRYLCNEACLRAWLDGRDA